MILYVKLVSIYGKMKGDFNMTKEKEQIEKHDRFDEEVGMTVVFPWEKEKKSSDDFKQEVDEKENRED